MRMIKINKKTIIRNTELSTNFIYIFKQLKNNKGINSIKKSKTINFIRTQMYLFIIIFSVVVTINWPGNQFITLMSTENMLGNVYSSTIFL